MIFTDPRLLDLTGFDRPHDAPSEDGELHLLRLALDLQLDAMLLTLGAAAAAESSKPGDGADAPWQRWLVEDLELARTLATALVDSDGAPLPALGGGLTRSDLESNLAALAVRFENMERLLANILARPTPGQTWRAAVGEALQRCRARLDELDDHRRRADAAESGSTTGPATSSHPGEWLG